MNYKIAGVDSIIIYFGDTIDPQTSQLLLSCYHNLKKKNLQGIIEIIPSYTTLFIQFDLFLFTHEDIFTLVKKVSQDQWVNHQTPGRQSRCHPILHQPAGKRQSQPFAGDAEKNSQRLKLKYD